jgi:hypothetical protein
MQNELSFCIQDDARGTKQKRKKGGKDYLVWGAADGLSNMRLVVALVE